MSTLDFEAPKPESESQTISSANFIRVFGPVIALVTTLGEAGVLTLLPDTLQKPVSIVILVLGFAAMCLGLEVQGKKIIDERIKRPTVWTEPGKDGENKSGAKMAIYLTAAQMLAGNIRDQLPENLIKEAEKIRDQETGEWGAQF